MPPIKSLKEDMPGIGTECVPAKIKHFMSVYVNFCTSVEILRQFLMMFNNT